MAEVKKDKEIVVMIKDYVQAVKKTTCSNGINKIVCYLEVLNHFISGKTFKRYCFITATDFDYIKMLYTNDIK